MTIDWLTALDAARLISAVVAGGFTLIELIDCRKDLASAKKERDRDTGELLARTEERLVAEANIMNDTCRLIICVVFIWLAMSSLAFPMKGPWFGVMFINRVALIVATFAVMYKSWRDRHLRSSLHDVWEQERRQRLSRSRRKGDYECSKH